MAFLGQNVRVVLSGRCFSLYQTSVQVHNVRIRPVQTKHEVHDHDSDDINYSARQTDVIWVTRDTTTETLIG